MTRALIVVAVIVIVLTVYAVVDCAMTDARRTKVLQKPIWLIAVLLLPVVGPLLWIFVGKQPLGATTSPVGPDEDVVYLDQLRRDSEHNARIRELEEQMRQLDAEIEQSRRETMRNHPSNTGSMPIIRPVDMPPKSADLPPSDEQQIRPDSDDEVKPE